MGGWTKASMHAPTPPCTAATAIQHSMDSRSSRAPTPRPGRPAAPAPPVAIRTAGPIVPPSESDIRPTHLGPHTSPTTTTESERLPSFGEKHKIGELAYG